MRRVVLWTLVAVVWVSVFGLVRSATGDPRSRCDDFTGEIGPPIACIDSGGPSVLPALPIASAAAVIVAAGGLAWIRRREDEPE